MTPQACCPVPDCTHPLRTKPRRRFFIIEHLRTHHRVPLEKSHGGNEAAKRRSHGRAFGAWLAANGYDQRLRTFFTGVRDGLGESSAVAVEGGQLESMGLEGGSGGVDGDEEGEEEEEEEEEAEEGAKNDQNSATEASDDSVIETPSSSSATSEEILVRHPAHPPSPTPLATRRAKPPKSTTFPKKPARAVAHQSPADKAAATATKVVDQDDGGGAPSRRLSDLLRSTDPDAPPPPPPPPPSAPGGLPNARRRPWRVFYTLPSSSSAPVPQHHRYTATNDLRCLFCAPTFERPDGGPADRPFRTAEGLVRHYWEGHGLPCRWDVVEGETRRGRRVVRVELSEGGREGLTE